MLDEESLFFLVLRILLGTVLVYHGVTKFLRLPNWISFMKSKNISEPVAIFAAISEIILGVMIILGLFTQVASIGVIIFMSVAIYLAHIGDPLQNWFYQICLITLSIKILIHGPGIYSLDK